MPTPAATKGSDSPTLRGGVVCFRCGAAHRGEEFAIRECTTRSGGVLLFGGSGLLLGFWLPVGLGDVGRFGLGSRGRPGLRRGPLVLGVGVGASGLFFGLSTCISGRFRLGHCGGYEQRSGHVNAKVGTSEESP